MSCLVVLFTGCSLFPSASKKSLNEKVKTQTSWTKDFSSLCDQRSELCAVGEGHDQTKAKEDAFKKILKIFETHIKVQNAIGDQNNKIELRDNKESYLNTHAYEASKDLSQFTVIRQSEIKNSKIFVLAVLDKTEAINYYNEKIQSLDFLNLSLFENFKRSTFKELMANLEMRENLSSRVKWLGGEVKDSTVHKDNIDSKKELLLSRPVTALVEINEGKFSGKIKDIITSELLNSFYEVRTEREDSLDYVWRASFVPRKEFLNVKGAEKFSFMLHIDVFSLKEQKSIGVLYTEETVVSKDIEEAFNLVLPKIHSYFLNNFTTILVD